MELLIILLILILIIIIVDARRMQLGMMKVFQSRIENLIEETSRLKEEIKKLSRPEPPAIPVKPEPVYKQQAEKIPVPAAPVIPKLNPELKEVAPPRHQPMHEIKESWYEKWLKNNPDLEKFIGENLVNKIGIAILVLGISFFVKYAIDKNWINETGRVSIGLLCGILLVGLAHYLRNTYRSFSSVLAGGGIAVFYFTIAFAFHQYSLISQTAAFVIMVFITSFAIVLSVLYDKVELAIIAAIGGFLTPFLVSTGQGNYIVLFTYIVILNAGLLALTFFKRWPSINVLAFLFTLFIFGGWMVKIENEINPDISYWLALTFLIILYLLFLGMNMVFQVNRKQEFRTLDYSLILLLNGSFFAAGIVLLSHINQGQYQGIFTLGAGFVNLCLAWYFFRTQKIQRNFLHLLIGLTVSFLSLAIPVQLHGHAITLFWSVELVLLFWLYQRLRINLFFHASFMLAVFTIFSLFMDWGFAGMEAESALLLIYTDIKGLVTNLVALAAFAALGILISREEQTKTPLPFTTRQMHQGAWLISFIIAYLTAVFGVNLILKDMNGYDVANVYHRIITQIALVIYIIYQFRKNRHGMFWPVVSAMMVYFLYHIFSFTLVQDLRAGVSTNQYSFIHMIMHWVSAISALLILFGLVKLISKYPPASLNLSQPGWIFSILLLFFFSQEMQHLFMVAAHREGNINYLQDQYGKAYMTIVWAICSFGLMWLGMKHKVKTFRIISLTVFSLALLKLFFYDIANVSEGGKIAAFILLGVLLLTISFMYQKLKKIIIDDGKS